jgi:hypothetical protein
MQTAAEIRNASHAAKRAAHAERRAQVLAALRECGAPVSTRALAEAMKWDVLCVRPRVTELYQAGLVVLDGRDSDGGLYRVATVAETLAFQATARTGGREVQDELPFTTRRRRY